MKVCEERGEPPEGPRPGLGAAWVWHRNKSQISAGPAPRLPAQCRRKAGQVLGMPPMAPASQGLPMHPPPAPRGRQKTGPGLRAYSRGSRNRILQEGTRQFPHRQPSWTGVRLYPLTSLLPLPSQMAWPPSQQQSTLGKDGERGGEGPQSLGSQDE